MKFGWKKALVGITAGLAVLGTVVTAYGATNVST